MSYWKLKNFVTNLNERGTLTFRSSRSEVFYGKSVYKKFVKFIAKRLFWKIFLNKITGLASSGIKKVTPTQVLFREFQKKLKHLICEHLL